MILSSWSLRRPDAQPGIVADVKPAVNSSQSHRICRSILCALLIVAGAYRVPAQGAQAAAKNAEAVPQYLQEGAAGTGPSDLSEFGNSGPNDRTLPDAPTPGSVEFFPDGYPSAVSALRITAPAALAPGLDGVPSGSSGWSSSSGLIPGPAVEPSARGYVPLEDCPSDETRARECRMHWKPMLLESAVFNAFENAGNLYTGYWYRWETMHGKWWDRYIASAAQWRWDRWSDDNPPLDDYVGHPMMGAITNSIWIQNDPKGMTLVFQNDRDYWHSRLRALAWSTFYSFEWKLGPLGEASVGHNGDHFFYDKGTLTNETGWVELVTTPVGGFGWTITEDYLDKHLVTKLEERSHNPILLTMANFFTPARGFANILRFRPPWYRDSRVVKANSFWSDPGEGVTASTAEAMRGASKHPDSGATDYLKSVAPAIAPVQPNWQGPGGRHEFGAWWGVSLISGHIWGYSGDVKYMPIDLHYSYEFYRHHESWSMRYSPELTAVAMLDWPTPNTSKSGTAYNQRTRAYGSGVSPVGFQWDLMPLRRVQPFFSGDGGFIYFADRVLSPQGSQFMYTIDYGAGLNIFHHRNQAITIGYRYQHLSNANISMHNPGTDANTFYVGISRFRTKGDDRPQRDVR